MPYPSLVDGLEIIVAWQEEPPPELFGGFRRPLGMVLQIDIGLHRMDAAYSVDKFNSVEYAFVVGHNQPGVGSSGFFAETEFLLQPCRRKG